MDLNIRRAIDNDAAAILNIFNQSPSAIANTLQMPYQGVEIWQERIQSKTVITLVADIEDQVVGFIGLHLNQRPRLRHTASFGMAVAEQYRGRGIGRALVGAVINLAENWHDIRRIEIEAYAHNAAALALYESMGFEREGLKRQATFTNGQYEDNVLLARLRPSP